MTQTILNKRGNKANLPALQEGEFAFCLDTKEVYVGDGSANYFVGRAMSGTESQRPGAGALGRFYRITSGTNVGYLYFDNGTAWERVNAQKITDLTGSLDDVVDGSTYSKVLKADITSGHINKVSDGTNTKTALEIKTHIDDVSKHRVINDSSTTITDLWSAQKIKNEIELAKHNIEPQASVKDKDLLTPPTSPAVGDRYIIGTGTGVGAWLNNNTKIAEWDGSSWDLYAPQTGWTCYVDDEQKVYSWNGTAWVRTGGALQTITAGNGLTGGGQADSVTLNVGAGYGISVGADTISAIAYKGITVDGNGIASNIDGTTIIYDSVNGNKLTIGTVDGGTF